MRTNQTKTPADISTIGIDIGKTTFHLVGLDQRGAIVVQQKVSRGQLEHRLVKWQRVSSSPTMNSRVRGVFNTIIGIFARQAIRHAHGISSALPKARSRGPLELAP